MQNNSFQAEIKAAQDADYQTYSWWLLAKDIADFTRLTFFQVFELSALEVFSTYQIMKAKQRINERKQKNK